MDIERWNAWFSRKETVFSSVRSTIPCDFSHLLHVGWIMKCRSGYRSLSVYIIYITARLGAKAPFVTGDLDVQVQYRVYKQPKS